MATAAVVEGKLTAPRWWPFLTSFPLLILITQPLSAARAIQRHLQRHWARYVLAVSLYVGLLVPTLLLQKKYPAAAASGTTVLILALGLSCLALVGSWCLDWRRFRVFRNNTTDIAPADFLAALGSYRWNSFRTRFIRLVATNMVLRANDKSIEVVRNLCLGLDRDLVRKPGTDSLETGLELVDRWRSSYIQRHRRTRKVGLKVWGNGVRDELALLERRLIDQRRFAEILTVSPVTAPKESAFEESGLAPEKRA